MRHESKSIGIHFKTHPAGVDCLDVSQNHNNIYIISYMCQRAARQTYTEISEVRIAYLSVFKCLA